MCVMDCVTNSVFKLFSLHWFCSCWSCVTISSQYIKPPQWKWVCKDRSFFLHVHNIICCVCKTTVRVYMCFVQEFVSKKLGTQYFKTWWFKTLTTSIQETFLFFMRQTDFLIKTINFWSLFCSSLYDTWKDHSEPFIFKVFNCGVIMSCQYLTCSKNESYLVSGTMRSSQELVKLPWTHMISKGECHSLSGEFEVFQTGSGDLTMESQQVDVSGCLSWPLLCSCSVSLGGRDGEVQRCVFVQEWIQSISVWIKGEVMQWNNR